MAADVAGKPAPVKQRPRFSRQPPSWCVGQYRRKHRLPSAVAGGIQVKPVVQKQLRIGMAVGSEERGGHIDKPQARLTDRLAQYADPGIGFLRAGPEVPA